MTDKILTNRQAIGVLDGLWSNPLFGETHRQAFEIGIKAIKALEQEPKTVLYSGDGYANGYMVYDMAECPNCGYEYEDGDKDWGLSFCPSCGQKLNWKSEDEK